MTAMGQAAVSVQSVFQSGVLVPSVTPKRENALVVTAPRFRAQVRTVGMDGTREMAASPKIMTVKAKRPISALKVSTLLSSALPQRTRP